MISCTRIFRFEAAHRLYGYDGACAAIHGHSYKVEVTATAPGLDKFGVIVDFGVLQKVIGGWIDEWWDHACILKNGDPLVVVWKNNSVFQGMKFYTMLNNPTAENMAWRFLDVCNVRLMKSPVSVVRVTIWETENSFATAEV